MSRLLDSRAQANLGGGRRVKCIRHGEGPGYVVCLHVLDGKAPVHFKEDIGRSHPTMGTILCAECTAVGGGAKVYLQQSDFGLACAKCAGDKGITRIGGRIAVAASQESTGLMLPGPEGDWSNIWDDKPVPTDGADAAQAASPEATKE